MSLQSHKRDWEDLAELDALWAIYTDPAGQHGRWELDKFFASGEAEVQSLMEKARNLRLPPQNKSVLDFGCGVGRLTRALSKHFQEACGVDVSEAMVAQARELNR